MRIISTSSTVYQLQNDDGSTAGSLTYTDSFIILQALHCAVCSMAMMNGFISGAIFS